MRLLRIGLVIDRLDPAKGGAEAYLNGLARHLTARGHEVHHLAQRFGPGVGAGQTHVVALPPLPRFLRDIAFDRAAARQAARLDLDVTLGVRHTPSTRVFQPHGGVYSRAQQAQARSAGRLGPWKALARRLRPKHLALLHLEAMQRRRRAAVVFVALSDRVRRDMTEVYRLQGPARPVRIYNGVDLARFRPDPSGGDRVRVRAAFDLAASAFVVLLVGHNFRLKGLAHVLAAVAGLAGSGVRLLVVGRGRPAPFRRQVRALGLDGIVRFAGETGAPERLYRAADVLAHPTYYDPCSCVCLEALASGLPVITTRTSGVGELIARGGGGVVLDEAGDEAGLRAALEALRADPARRRRLAGEARRLAEAHPEEAAFEALEDVLIRAAASRR